jgi:hypothetical protein
MQSQVLMCTWLEHGRMKSWRVLRASSGFDMMQLHTSQHFCCLLEATNTFSIITVCHGESACEHIVWFLHWVYYLYATMLTVHCAAMQLLAGSEQLLFDSFV